MSNALKTYFAATGDTPSQMARRIGKPYSTVWRVMNGRRAASPTLARTISEATKGIVTPVQVISIVIEEQADPK